MTSIHDWATRAALRIKSERSASTEHIAAIIATFAEPLLKVIHESRREHRHVELVLGSIASTPVPVTAFCCPQCTCLSWGNDEPDAEHEPNSDEPCNCGASIWNEKIERALS